MNEFGIALFWCAVQVTALSLAAGLCYLVARRFSPSAGSLVTLTGLMVVIALSVLAFSPWPQWTPLFTTTAQTNSASTESAQAADSSEDGIERTSASANGSGTDQTEATVDPNGRLTEYHSEDEPAFAALFWEAFKNALRTRPAEAGQPQPWRWPALLGMLVLVGICVGAVRLVLGWAAVRSYRRRSRTIRDPQLLQLADVICAELSFTKPIEVRHSTELVTAATVGWRRPLILLPSCWRRWTEQERRAVLAHEIAHISRNDFLAWICAQVGVVLHFYHPLVHWLAGRLRLEQELAADATAAALSGGQYRYLQTLAAMALRQADRPVAWPARTFLPTRRTFLRRIEMLRDTKHLAVTTLSRGARVTTVGLLVLAGIAVAGLRAPNDSLNAQSDEFRAAKVATAVKQAPKRTDAQRAQSQINLRKIGLAFHNYHATFGYFPPAAVIGPDGKTPYSWRVALLPFLDQAGLYQQYNKNEPWDSPNNKKVLAKMPDVFRDPSMDPKSTNSAYFVLTGDVTAFNDEKGTRMREFTDGLSNTIMAVEAKRNIPWTKPVDIPYDADPKKKFPKLGGFDKGRHHVLMSDSAIRFIPEEIDVTVLRALFTFDGGEKVTTELPPLYMQIPKDIDAQRL